MFSFKKPNKTESAFRCIDVKGPDFDKETHVYLYEINTAKVPQHVLDSQNTCELLAEQYNNEIINHTGGVQGTAEILAPGTIQVFGKNKLMLSPDRVDNQRHCIFLAGSPGSGKSYWINDYALRWIELFPDGKIVVISRKTKEDEHNFKFDYQQADPTIEDQELIGLNDVKLHQKEQ